MSIWDPKETLESIGGSDRKSGKRSSKVAEALREELSILLLDKVGDARLHCASISRVEVTGDLSLARIFYTVIGNQKEIREAEKGFARACGFMRSHIAKCLNLRFTPVLEFRYDTVMEKVAELDEIFREINDERKSRDEDS